MESEKRLASSPSAPPSFQRMPSLPRSSPAPLQSVPIKYSPAPSPGGSIPLTIFGQTYQTGELGLSALPAHSQFKAFPELWRPAEMDNRRAAALFNPLLGLHPLFAPAFNNHSPADSQLCSSVCAGGNGWGSSFPNRSLNISPLRAKEKEKTPTNSSWIQQNLCEFVQHQNTILTGKEKDHKKSQPETPKLNGCLSGSLSESSSEETSSDSDNMEKDDEDLSSGSDDSDSENEVPVKKKHLMHNTSESKEKGPLAGEGNACRESFCCSLPVTSADRLQSHAHPAGLPTCTALFFHTARTAEERSKQHTSVIHPTRLAIDSVSLTQSHGKARPSHSNPVPNPKHQIPSSSPNQSSFSEHLCAGLLKPLIIRPPTLSTSKRPSNDDRNNERNKNSPYEGSSHPKRMKKASSAQPRRQICDPELLLNPHPNRAISAAGQDVPLALITKPCNRANSPKSRPLLAATCPPYLTPIDLSTGTNESSDTFASPPESSAPGLVPGLTKAGSVPRGGWRPAKASSCQKPVDLSRSSGYESHSSKALEDSSGDEEEESSVDDDSGSSLSDSESNPESEVAGNHRRECFKAEARRDAGMSAPKAAEESLSFLNFSSDRHLAKPSALPSTNVLEQHGTLPPSSVTFSAAPGSKKQRRATDERILQIPLKFGWQRETRMRCVAGRLQGEVAYFAPCGKKLRQYPDVVKYLVRHGITDISRDNFSFSTKIKVGNFYEGREGPKGVQWFLMAEEDIAPCIIAMDGRRSRQAKSTEATYHPPVNYGQANLQDSTDAKLTRKLQAREMARQAAQIKMMRKLEKQAFAQATKEAKKQQAIMAAEERRKKREERKFLKQQEKLKRIQHIRMEKELRAQRVLEEKRKKKEAAANVKMLEAEKRSKEREIRKLQSVIQKHQEQERYRLDMERERRRQHMILMKAVEARRKAEEKERLKKEKKQEKQLNKKNKLELRRLELKKAKELKKPKEDMCLTDHKPLPELSCIPGIILPGKTFSDCLMVLQFVRNFGTVLKLGLNPNQLTISSLQDGLLNNGSSLQKVQDLLVSMLSAAVCDPGVPAGHKCKTLLGYHLTNVEINRDNVSEILQIYMEAHSGQKEVSALAHSLQTKAFQAHSPSEKAAMLAFLVNELCCSKAVISEIDKNIDYMTNLRKDKWILEGKLRKLRNIHAKTIKKTYSDVREENHTFGGLMVQKKSKRKNRDSEEDEDQDEDSEDRGEDDDEEEELREKKRKKVEMCEEEAATHSEDMNKLETKIQKTCKMQSEISRKLFDASHSLRSMMVGEDRYRRRYWLLPQCGGLFIEGAENGSGEVEERKQGPCVRVKEERQEEISEQTETAKTKAECQKNKDDILLQKSSSKLSEVLDGAKMDQDSNFIAERTHPIEVCITEPHSSCRTPQTDKSSPSSVLNAARLNNTMTCHAQSSLPDDRLSNVLTVKSSEWFSLLPRSPCDGSSVVSNTSRPVFLSSSQLVRTNPSTFHVPNTSKKNPKSGISRLQSAVSQEAEGNRDEDLCLADCNSVNKRETTQPLSKKPTASFPSREVAKPQDCVCPQLVPEEMLRGWWRVSNVENLHTLLKALHSRGIRERVLQKQIQKNMEHMTQIYANSTNEFDTKDPEMQKLSREIFKSWCVEQRAMEVDTSLLRQVEALEKNVIAANLHTQGWMPCEPRSDSKDLAYFEHKPSSVSLENKNQGGTQQEKRQSFPARRSNNPLDIAVTRLAELERNIERSNQEEAVAGMRQWHKALAQVRSSAQLSLCIQHLQKSIVWKQDVTKLRCQFCLKGDNEELLLLCDGCEKGCHTYCHNPKITTVPAGDWFCSLCGGCAVTPNGKQESRTAGGKQRGGEVKQNCKLSVIGEKTACEGAASSNGVPETSFKELKNGKGEDGCQAMFDNPVSCAKKAKTPKDSNNDLAACRMLLSELEAHQDAWPFLSPVRHKSVPGYRKVIKKPMDFSTIKEKLTNNLYLNLETFIIDVNLVFDNCQKFNEDDSEIGRAGHRMRRFFDKRWTELL